MKVDVNPTFHMEVDKTNLEINPAEMDWFVYPSLFKVAQFPLQLDIETNTVCNIRCVKCFHSERYIEPLRMPMELIKKIIREGSYKGLQSIKLQYRGEPLLYRGIEEVIRYAKQYGIKEVMFNTNATLLNKGMVEILVKAGLDKIICSIDSYVKEIYEKLHRGAKFDVVVNNLLHLQVYKKVERRLRPILRVQKVMQKGNEHESNEKYIKFWSIIADQVAIEEFIDYSDTEERIIVKRDWACPQLWQRLFVWADGTVHPCCCLESQEVGDIHSQTIEDVWVGETMKKLRLLHQKGQSHKIEMCRRCSLRKHEYSKNFKPPGKSVMEPIWDKITEDICKDTGFTPDLKGGIGGEGGSWGSDDTNAAEDYKKVVDSIIKAIKERGI